MPVAGPYRSLRAGQRRADNRIPVRAVRLAAVVLPPCSFVRILVEQVAADPMVLADLGPAQSREIPTVIDGMRPRKSGSHRTRCWREMDSNHRYRIRNNLFWLPPFGPRNSPSATKTGSFVPGTEGSNPSPSSEEFCELLVPTENPVVKARRPNSSMPAPHLVGLRSIGGPGRPRQLFLEKAAGTGRGIEKQHAADLGTGIFPGVR